MKIQDSNLQVTLVKFVLSLINIGISEQILTFLKNTVQLLSVSLDDVRIGFVTFSNDAHLEFLLNRYNNAADVINAILHVPYLPGGTATKP